MPTSHWKSVQKTKIGSIFRRDRHFAQESNGRDSAANGSISSKTPKSWAWTNKEMFLALGLMASQRH